MHYQDIAIDTLALYPNNRGIAYAMFNSPKYVIDCGLKQVTPVNNSKCMTHMAALISLVNPARIIVREPHAKDKRHERLRKLIGLLKRHAKKQEVKVIMTSREDIRFVFEQFNARNKDEINEVLVKWYPELDDIKPEPRKYWKAESYFQGVFDAVALGVSQYFKDEP